MFAPNRFNHPNIHNLSQVVVDPALFVPKTLVLDTGDGRFEWSAELQAMGRIDPEVVRSEGRPAAQPGVVARNCSAVHVLPSAEVPVRRTIRRECTDQLAGPWDCMGECYQHPPLAVDILAGSFVVDEPAAGTQSVAVGPFAVASFAAEPFVAGPFAAGTPWQPVAADAG